MLKAGIAGIGMMGATHLDAYAKLDGVEVVAVADLIEERREGLVVVGGNVKGQSQGGGDFSRFRKYSEAMDLIADPDLDIIDICLPTPLHAAYAAAALGTGRHVLTEKPFAINSTEAASLLQAAASAKGMLMCAMCMRFWPAWAWLKDTIASNDYGAVRSAGFRRVTSHPGGFYRDGDACGGAILDLHIHDTDFIQHCFGVPKAVFSRGYAKDTNRIDHVTTQYLYDTIPMVVAEGGWSMQPGFGFEMQYTVNFENATAVFDINAADQLRVIHEGRVEPVAVKAGMGYEHEIAYFIDCLQKGEHPRLVDPAGAALSVRLVEAELESVNSGCLVSVSP